MSNQYQMPKVIPSFRREKQKKVIPWKTIFTSICFSVFLISLVYLLFLSPVFKIKDIELSATTQINHDEVLAIVKNDAVGKNIFFWDKSNVERAIGDHYPLAVNLLVYKGLPNTIKVVIQETTPKIDWKTSGKIYLVDDNGQVLKEGNNDKLIKVVDTKNLVINSGDKILPQFFISFLDDFISEAQKINLKIDHFEVSESLYDLSAVTDKKIKLILSPDRSATDALKEYQQATGKVGQPKEYIDLRFPNRAFVK